MSSRAIVLWIGIAGVLCGLAIGQSTTPVDDTVRPSQPVPATVHVGSLTDVTSLMVLSEPATLPVTSAVRSTSTQEVPTTILSAVGINGLPFAPEGLDLCAEMEWYRVQWQLPERFGDSGRHQRWVKSDGYGWRESKCNNAAISPGGCCGGYWQLFINTFIAHGHSDELSMCDVDELGDVTGVEPYDKQRQACVTGWLFFLSGEGDSPWAGT